MLNLAPQPMEDVEALGNDTFVSKSAPTLETVPYISKTFVAYFEFWLAASPYYISTIDHPPLKF